MAKKKSQIIQCSPVGWWYNDGRVVDQWSGPFDTPEEAEKIAKALAPEKVEFIKLLRVAPWEKREVRVEPVRKYQKCPDCKDGFRGDRCCRKCEGSGRIEV